ncbi:MAG: FAD-dependent oxidoreductase [Chloroflexi bacterium]|nr:FAD-dependent oxidoreductase [Chloroflexota bacterium]
MPIDETFVIIGAGQAGGCAAAALRADGFDGRVILLGEEPFVPYERPPLSKQVLAGAQSPESTFLRPAEFYHEQAIELRLGTRAVAIDHGARRVGLSDGEPLEYDKLLLTTGSRVRRFSLPGAELSGIFYLRDIDDSLAIASRLDGDAAVVVVGGGYIGLEVAATARRRGCRVTILEMQDVLMSRAVAPEIGQIFADIHTDHGVHVHTGVLTPMWGVARPILRIKIAKWSRDKA